MSTGTIPHRVIRASAGSGKTHQLTNRYLRLIAGGVPPDSILATTFTRKAAGEILNRVLKRLAEAAVDPIQAGALAHQIEISSDYTSLLRTMVSQLHRIRIGTLDSFYLALASQFGLELGLPGGWSIIEEPDDQAMRDDALERMLKTEEADILFVLFERLAQGQTTRGVRDFLIEIVTDLYDIHQETSPDVWKKINISGFLDPKSLDVLLSKIEAFDLSAFSGLVSPRDQDLERARTEDWGNCLSKGLCQSILKGTNTFRKTAVPDDLISLYRPFIAHAGAALLRTVARQTEATREFLDKFHSELTNLKRDEDGLRFNEVTLFLKHAAESHSIPDDAVSFRLDGAIDHLLLDEFQDTALAQWQVMRPIAKAITSQKLARPSSFFCVGDAKQAIYGWRGGMAAIFDTLESSLGKLDIQPLEQSRRSAQPIIDVVNRVFGNLELPDTDKCDAAFKSWANRFQPHSTVKSDAPGYVRLQTGPAQNEDQGLREQRLDHCAYVAQQIQQLLGGASPPRSVGVLCRTKDIVTRIMFELGQLGIEARDEAGAAIDDSPAVESLLSLFMWADHPGHSIARFHLEHSPFQGPMPATAAELRREILERGYGETALTWATRLASSCNRRDLGRLQQFVDLAYAFEARSSLRSSDFVSWVRNQRVAEPSTAHIRVMTIHAAKGLEFDAVVLPQLDTMLIGRPPAFVVGRDAQTLTPHFVSRYASVSLQRFLPAEQQAAFTATRQNQIEEMLSLLYVAMTRAIHGLYLFIPGPRLKKQSDPWYKLLLQTLSPNSLKTPFPAQAILYEKGDVDWPAKIHSDAIPTTEPKSSPSRITFRKLTGVRRRNLDLAAPSKREGGGQMSLGRLFDASDVDSLDSGTLHHAWFAAIKWLDGALPTDEILRPAAGQMRNRVSARVWARLDSLMIKFREFLGYPEIAAIFRKSSYSWSRPVVERERRFECLDGDTIWAGSVDRIVWRGELDSATGADLIDFKTDEFVARDEAALATRVAYYRPQLEIYRRAMARISGLKEEQITARLAFVAVGRVVDV